MCHLEESASHPSPSARGVPQVLKTIGCVSEYSVKNRELGRIVGTRSKPTTIAKLVLSLELSLEPIQPNLGPRAREGVAVDAAGYTSTLVDKKAWARLALCKNDVLREP